MRLVFTLWFCLIIQVPAIAQFSESFADGDFTNNPTWTGMSSSFIIEAGQLKSNSATDNDLFYLSTPSSNAAGMVWQFYVNLKFPTSSANYMDVMLMSDSANLKNTKNGYFIRIGNTKDEISLYKIFNGTTTEIISGRDNLLNSSESFIKLRLTRTNNYQFVLEDDISGTGTDYFYEGTITDSSVKTSNHTGIKIKQSTGTFHKKHFFDNYTITGYTPTFPKLSKIQLISEHSVELTFQEAADSVSAKNNMNYQLSFNTLNPLNVVYDAVSKNKVTLTFADPFPEKTPLKIYVSNIKNLFGNLLIKDSIPFIYIRKEMPLENDLLFSEIMPMPTPVVGSLPPLEYIEIINRSGKYLNLSGSFLADASAKYPFPDSVIAPGSFAILCGKSASIFFKPFGKVIPFESFPTLNDFADSLSIVNDSGHTVCFLNYAATWFDKLKIKGGWSLERIDTANLCEQRRNFAPCKSSDGGTPGKINSVNGTNPDLVAPEILFGFMENDKSAVVFFSEPMHSTTLLNTQNYLAMSSQPLMAEAFNINHSASKVTFNNAFVPGTIFNLEINNMKDCAGNVASTTLLSLSVPETAGNNANVVINEILFDPKSFDDDFIELYNRGTAPANLKELLLANTGSDGLLDDITEITPYPIMLMPGQYLAITTSAQNIINYYPSSISSSILETRTLPSFSNTSGTAILLNKFGHRFDSFSYNSSMHFTLLNEVEGVSLERIDFNRSSLDPNNWHSASASAGFATPGAQNSMYSLVKTNTSTLSALPESFSPDGDGFDDILNLSINLSEPGYYGSISIFDANGYPIKKVVPQQTFGQQAKFAWDGTNKDGNMAPVGLYVAFLEAFKPGAETIHKKATFALMRRQ